MFIPNITWHRDHRTGKIHKIRIPPGLGLGRFLLGRFPLPEFQLLVWDTPWDNWWSSSHWNSWKGHFWGCDQHSVTSGQWRLPQHPQEIPVGRAEGGFGLDPPLLFLFIFPLQARLISHFPLFQESFWSSFFLNFCCLRVDSRAIFFLAAPGKPVWNPGFLILMECSASGTPRALSQICISAFLVSPCSQLLFGL